MELGNKATISLADFRLLLFGNATLHFVVFNFRMKHTYLHPERLINENGNTLLCMVLLLQEDVQREGDLEKCDEGECRACSQCLCLSASIDMAQGSLLCGLHQKLKL